MAVAVGCGAAVSPGTLAADAPSAACVPVLACVPLLVSRAGLITPQTTGTGMVLLGIMDPTPTMFISIHSTIASGRSVVIRHLMLPGGGGVGDGAGVHGCGVPGMTRTADSTMNMIGSMP